MVRFLALILLLFAPNLAPAAEPVPEVGSALGKSSLPWYDASKDQARPIDVQRTPEVTVDRPSRMPTVGWGLGNIFAFVGFAVAVVVLVGLLIWFYRLYEPSADAGAAATTRKSVTGHVVDELPVGLPDEFRSSDPWQEALRRRASGDLAGAIVCLFAHQLLTLSRLGLVRLAPGRTCRQLVKAVADVEFRGLVHPTLRLFEGVYYGHRTPDVVDFDAAWADAEAFERRVAAGGLP